MTNETTGEIYRLSEDQVELILQALYNARSWVDNEYALGELYEEDDMIRNMLRECIDTSNR